MLGSSEVLTFEAMLQLDVSLLILIKGNVVSIALPIILPPFWHLPVFLIKSEDSEVSGICLSLSLTSGKKVRFHDVQGLLLSCRTE